MGQCSSQRDLWIDTVLHTVDARVWAEFQRLKDLLNRQTEALERAHVAMRVHRILNGPEHGRWSAPRKEEILLLIQRRVISEDEACMLYVISAEELQLWKAGYEAHGRAGLMVTRLQVHRDEIAS